MTAVEAVAAVLRAHGREPWPRPTEGPIPFWRCVSHCAAVTLEDSMDEASHQADMLAAARLVTP